MRNKMRGWVWLTAFVLSVSALFADEHPLLRPCLRGSDNQQEIAKSKRACTEYIADLMRDVRFGTSTNLPFCVPNRDLTDEENLLNFKKFSADNPEIPETNRYVLSAVIATKAYPCRAKIGA